jgi:hypothetical protein
MKRGIIWLLIGIPLTSVLMGAATLYVAFSNPDPVISKHQPTLSKTSWRDDFDLEDESR